VRLRATLAGTALAALAIGLPNAIGNTVGPWQADNVAFGGQAVGSPTTQTLTINETDLVSAHAIDPGGVQVSGTNQGDFTLSNNTCDGQLIALGGNCTVDVTFTPSVIGGESAQINLSYDGGQVATDLADLTGTGLGAAVNLSPNPLGLGSLNLGQSTTGTVTLNNTGNATLNVTSVAVSGGGGSFAIQADGCTGTVTASNHCSVTVIFQPQAVGGSAANLVFTDNAADSPQSAALSGTGTSPILQIVPTSHTFGSLTIGKLGPTQQVTVSNSGTGPLPIAGVNVTGTNPGSFPITADTCANATVPAGQSCTVTVQYTPKLTGSLEGTLVVHSTPKATVVLTGIGTPPPAVENVRAAAGCSATLLTWKPNSSVAGFLSTVIIRRHRRAPRSPSDGVVLNPKTAGRLHDGGLRHHSTYHYALFARYRFHAGGPVVYSKPSKQALTTRRICAPMNNQLISTRTPRVSWIPFNNALGYNLQVWQGGKKIYSPQMKPAHFKIPASHALKPGKTYTLKLYAYTRGRTHGHLRIGTSTFQTT
jgi:hypothetical protein